MTSIEQTGKNIDEATRLALEQLKVTEDQVDVEIIEEGSKGFLGLGQSPARVRVTVKKVARSQRPERPERAERPERPERAERAEPSAPKPRTRQRTRSRSKSKPEAIKVEETNITPEKVAAVEERPARVQAPPVVVTEEAMKQAAEKACEIVQRMLDGIGAGGTASVKGTTDNQVGLEVQGGDAAVLIGRHGQTIDAIQYLVNVTTHKQTGVKVRVSIDVGGYRTRREEALTNQAMALAEKVKESGQEAVLDPLPANERRIIHAALAENADVYTYSEGQEPGRYVVISPKNKTE